MRHLKRLLWPLKSRASIMPLQRPLKSRASPDTTRASREVIRLSRQEGASPEIDTSWEMPKDLFRNVYLRRHRNRSLVVGGLQRGPTTSQEKRVSLEASLEPLQTLVSREAPSPLRSVGASQDASPAPLRRPASRACPERQAF